MLPAYPFLRNLHAMSVLNLLNAKVVVGLGFLYVLAHLVGRRRGRRSLPYPPGPKGESNYYTSVGGN